MDTTTFSQRIFDALQEFDRTVQPFGLYSVRDIPSQPKPQTIVAPFEKQVELRGDLSEVRRFCDSLANVGRWGTSNTPHFFLDVPHFGAVSIQMMRVAKIKVRQYGSRYHLDKNQNYERRWEQLELLKLRHRRAEKDWQMLLFLGFDKAVRPFERELSELKPHQTRESHGIEFFERAWDDSMGRGFKVKATLWMHPLPYEEATASREAGNQCSATAALSRGTPIIFLALVSNSASEGRVFSTEKTCI